MHIDIHAIAATTLSRIVIRAIFLAWTLGALPSMAMSDQPNVQRIDPAAWGDDHVGKPLPEYITGDECLFCHRDIGGRWGDNRHQLTMRMADPRSLAIKLLGRDPNSKDFAQQVRLLLGSGTHVRFLKQSKEYGKLDLLSTAYRAESDGTAKLLNSSRPTWDTTTFANKCAGCHATGVHSTTKAFSSVSLDCFTCHGSVELEHTKNESHVLLSSQNREARQVVSICGQCHLRGGQSRSTRRPYPNNFVAGDNLFRDFQVNWSDSELTAMNPGDRHIFDNVRSVAVLGNSDVTCLSCHDVHAENTSRHQELEEAASCNICHLAEEPKSVTRSYRARSKTCGY